MKTVKCQVCKKEDIQIMENTPYFGIICSKCNNLNLSYSSTNNGIIKIQDKWWEEDSEEYTDFKKFSEDMLDYSPPNWLLELLKEKGPNHKKLCHYCNKDLTNLPRLYMPHMQVWLCGIATCKKAPKAGPA